MDTMRTSCTSTMLYALIGYPLSTLLTSRLCASCSSTMLFAFVGFSYGALLTSKLRASYSSTMCYTSGCLPLSALFTPRLCASVSSTMLDTLISLSLSSLLTSKLRTLFLWHFIIHMLLHTGQSILYKVWGREAPPLHTTLWQARKRFIGQRARREKAIRNSKEIRETILTHFSQKRIPSDAQKPSNNRSP